VFAARTALLLALAGCGARGPGQAWASRDGSTYIYENGEHHEDLISVRGAQRHTFKRSAGCFTSDPDRVLLTEDGRRALLLGWHKVGGTWLHHVETELNLACVLDLVTGATAAIAVAMPGVTIGDGGSDVGDLIVGARSGWTYVRGDFRDELAVVDKHGQRATVSLAGDAQGGQCALVERDDGTVVVCARFLQTARSDAGSTYRYWLESATLDRSTFPPTLTNRRQIDVVRAESVRLSRDGRLAAWWYGGFGGVVELASGRSLGDVSGGQLWDMAFNADGSELAVIDENPAAHFVLRRIAVAGMAEQQRVSLGEEAYRVYWLADGRLLVSGYSWSKLITPKR
jgi:hypothetical protein